MTAKRGGGGEHGGKNHDQKHVFYDVSVLQFSFFLVDTLALPPKDKQTLV